MVAKDKGRHGGKESCHGGKRQGPWWQRAKTMMAKNKGQGGKGQGPWWQRTGAMVTKDKGHDGGCQKQPKIRRSLAYVGHSGHNELHAANEFRFKVTICCSRVIDINQVRWKSH